MAWLRNIGGRLKPGYRYSIGLVGNISPLLPAKVLPEKLAVLTFHITTFSRRNTDVIQASGFAIRSQLLPMRSPPLKSVGIVGITPLDQ